MKKSTIVVISADKHSGSSLGLIKAGIFAYHDGGSYNPSYLQGLLWAQYDECLDQIAKMRKGKRLIWVENGDVCEGIHHNTTQLVSARRDEHERIATDILDYTFTKLDFARGDLAYMTAGTEEHGGAGSQSENNVAKDMGFVPQYAKSSGVQYRYTWDRLMLDVNGILFDVSHHGASSGQRAWTTENSLRFIVKSTYFTCLETKTRIPRYWIRSHMHRYVRSGIYEGAHGKIEGFISPSFQFKTGYAYKIASGQLSDIGMLVFEVSENGESKEYPMVATYEQDKTIEV